MRFFLKIPAFGFATLMLSLTAVSLPAASLEDWTLEDVLEKVAEANGGPENIKKVTNVRIRGDIESPAATYSFVLLKKRPDKFRLGLSYQGRSIDSGFDGSTCWRSVDLGLSHTVVELTGDERKQMLIEADFDGPLIGDAPPDSERHLIGTERIDRVDYFVVEFDSPRGSFHHYVDSRTFRELKVEQFNKADKKREIPVKVTYYHDYKRFESIWVSMRVEHVSENGDTEIVLIRDVEVNPGLLDFIFDMPEEREPLAP